jgi:hypothetical protein
VEYPGVGTVIATADGLEARAAIEATDAAVEGWQVWPPERVVPVGRRARSPSSASSASIAQDLTTAAGWRPQDPDAGSTWTPVSAAERPHPSTGEPPGGARRRARRVARAWVRAPAAVPRWRSSRRRARSRSEGARASPRWATGRMARWST